MFHNKYMRLCFELKGTVKPSHMTSHAKGSGSADPKAEFHPTKLYSQGFDITPRGVDFTPTRVDFLPSTNMHSKLN